MRLDDKISQIRTLIAQRDDIDRQIAELLGDEDLSVPPNKKSKGKRDPNKTEKDLADEVDQRVGRSRIDPTITKEVEDRLIAGESVAAIHENVDVSAPTIYVIKKRLQKEGKL